MHTHIDTYLEAMESRWAATTLKSERHRLNNVRSLLDNGPENLYTNLIHLAPYSRRTTWIRVVHYVDWLIEEKLYDQVNDFKKYGKANRRLFNNSYRPNIPIISYDEAKIKVTQIPDKSLQEAALSLLKSGLRVHELGKVHAGRVVGKGGKERTVHNTKALDVSYQRLHAALKKVGLKPHDLRKLFATEMVSRGANEFELTELMGWSSIVTAQSYVRANPDKLKKLVEGL